jgi:hypothetical protein
LCCGHVFILQAAESPYFYGTEKKLEDLVFAVNICSQTFEQAQAAFDVDHPEEWKQWRRECRKLDFAEETIHFESYWHDHIAMPVRETSAQARGSLHPWPLLVAVSVMKVVGESRAWNMPLPMAMSINSVLGELKGDTSLISEWNWEILDRAKKYREQMKAV